MRIFTKNDKGAAAIEFAIILPLLLLIVFGIIELGFVVYNQAMITNASREGARAAIVYDFDIPNNRVVRLSDAEIEDRVEHYIRTWLISFGPNPDHTITINPGDRDNREARTPVAVEVDYRYDFLILHAFARPLNLGVNLSSGTIMLLE